MLKALTLALGLALCGATLAQSIEVFSLHSRNAQSLLPALRPHLASDTTISAHGNQLIVRGSEQQIAQVKALLRELDTPPQSVLISLRFDSESSGERAGGSIGGTVDAAGARARVRVYSSDSATSNAGQSQVRGLAGAPARFSETVLVPIQDRTVWAGAESSGVQTRTALLRLDEGFYVTPYLRGDRVELEISVASRNGLAQRRIVTTVAGALGEWIPLAGASDARQSQERAYVLRSEDAHRREHLAWIRVQRLD